MTWTNDEDRNAWFRERYRKNVEYIKQLKLESGCKDCGYNEHPAVLEFDHVMPRLRGTVSGQMGKSLRIILEEVARCEIVCANCHNLRTWTRQQGKQP